LPHSTSRDWGRNPSFVERLAIYDEGINPTMAPTNHDEVPQDAALALWRYAHDYLRAGQTLCRQHRIRCMDSQVPYHVAAQGIEFALKAYLRTKGASMRELRAELRHSLSKALALCEAKGMTRLPPRYRVAIEQVSNCHRDTQFLYLATTEDALPDLEPVVDAGVWILDWIAPHVVEHFVVYRAGATSTAPADFVRRLRADLSATSNVVPAQARRPPEAPMGRLASDDA
jgi:hypothetical protein